MTNWSLNVVPVRLPLFLSAMAAIMALTVTAREASLHPMVRDRVASFPLRSEPSGRARRLRRYAVESSRVVNTFCPASCYTQLVWKVGPVNISGLVEIKIEKPPLKKTTNAYDTSLEAFQQVCWVYRQYTTRCLAGCNISNDKEWFQDVFFNILHNYCATYYDEVVQNWDCYEKLANDGISKNCELNCQRNCDVNCPMNCHRPLANEMCADGDAAINVVANVVRIVLPKIVGNIITNGQRLACEQEITMFLRAR